MQLPHPEPLALKKACAALDPPIAFTKRAAGAGDPKNKAELGGGHLAAMTKTFGLYPPFLHIYGAVRVDKYRQGLYMPFIAHNRHKVLPPMQQKSTHRDFDGRVRRQWGDGSPMRPHTHDGALENRECALSNAPS